MEGVDAVRKGMDAGKERLLAAARRLGREVRKKRRGVARGAEIRDYLASSGVRKLQVGAGTTSGPGG